MYFFLYFFRYFSGSVITSVGIIWSESLQNRDYFKSFAYLVKNLLENYTDIQIPLNSPVKPKEESILRTSFGLRILGLIVSLGFYY